MQHDPGYLSEFYCQTCNDTFVLAIGCRCLTVCPPTAEAERRYDPDGHLGAVRD